MLNDVNKDNECLRCNIETQGSLQFSKHCDQSHCLWDFFHETKWWRRWTRFRTAGLISLSKAYWIITTSTPSSLLLEKSTTYGFTIRISPLTPVHNRWDSEISTVTTLQTPINFWPYETWFHDTLILKQREGLCLIYISLCLKLKILLRLNIYC